MKPLDIIMALVAAASIAATSTVAAPLAVGLDVANLTIEAPAAPGTSKPVTPAATH